MAFMQIEYSSQVLGQYRQVDVIYPDRDQISMDEADSDIPVLYLLHGMGGNHNSWAFRTNIQRLLRKTNLIVIMPNSENGWYTNTKYGINYFDAIAKELPKVMKRFFPSMTSKREKTFIAGLSMGGYGAYKLALLTNQFACAGSFSGALAIGIDGKNLVEVAGESQNYWQGIFGDLQGDSLQEHFLTTLAERSDKKTKFYAWCGYEDFLYQSSEVAVQKLRQSGLDIDYRTDHGTHDWYYWEKQLEVYLEWLPINYVKEERLS
ncbi:alpha/beta hydrolase [Streptococcus dentiloxodontae]